MERMESDQQDKKKKFATSQEKHQLHDRLFLCKSESAPAKTIRKLAPQEGAMLLTS
jgi:hypothetical protein